MRIVGLHLRGDPGSALALHPNLSVVTGVPVAVRRDLAQAIGDLLRGSTGSDVVATVEIAGETRDVEAPGLQVLRRPVDLLVQSSDLPRRSGGGSSAAATIDQQRRKAQHAETAARTSLAALEQPAAAARADHRDAVASLEQARAAVRQARQDLDPYAAARLDAALQAAARTEAELELAPGTCRADTLEAVKDRIVLLETQQRDLAAVLDVRASADPRPVADALDVVRTVTATEQIAPLEVMRLADEWAVISEHLAALEAKFAGDEGGVQSASDRLDAARARVARSEAALAPAPASADDVRALEAAHEKVLVAERRASSRLGGSRARRALDEALAGEQIFLDRLGYPTWSAWIMGAPLLDEAATRTRAVEQAQLELAEATESWERLTAKLEEDAEFRGLLDRLERVLEAAHAIVGDVDDVEAALRGLRLDPGPPPCGEREARDALAAAMADAGFAVEDDATTDALRVRAERWLAELHTVTALRRQLEFDGAQCGAELHIAREAFERIQSNGERVYAGRSAHDPRLHAARAELLAAEGRVMRHRAAIARLAHLVAEAEGLAELERQLGLAADAREELLDATREIAESSAARVQALGEVGGWQAPTDEEEAVIGVLDVRITAARLAADGEPMPLLLDDALDAMADDAVDTVLGWLETVSADTQLVYFSDRPSVLAWARRRSAERVGVLDGAPLVAAG